MPKKLEDMSFEELGQLFPIILSEHNPIWHDKYLLEKPLIENAVGPDNIIRINHIGSTSIDGLIAKPTIDILLEIDDNTDTNKLIENIISIGYLYSFQPDNPPPHMMFMKGYTENGFKGQAYHLHVRYFGDWDELYFRDYLMLHKNTAREYGKLKQELKEKYEHDRESYTECKTDFIKKTTALARNDFDGKYKKP